MPELRVQSADARTRLARLLTTAAGAMAFVLALSGCTTTTTSADQSLPDGVPAGAERMTVDHVHDGDTLWAVDSAGEKIKIRLIGVNTPEVTEPAECYSAEATTELSRLAPTASVLWAVPDREPTDRYGRELLYLWTADGTFINYELVEGGFGVALRVRPNDRYFSELKDAESSARAAGLGLWGACDR